MSDALVSHDGLDISEVKIDQCRQVDQIRDAGHCLLQNLICLLECFRHGRSAVHYLEQLVIGDNDQSINILLQLADAGKRIVHADPALETERLGDNADCKDAEFSGNSRDDRCRACAGAAAHTAGDKYHVCTLNGVLDLLRALFRSLLANFRLSPCTKTLGDLLTDLDDCGSLGHCQCLFICIDADELNACNRIFHHAVHSIIACAANADYDNPCAGLGFIRHNL